MKTKYSKYFVFCKYNDRILNIVKFLQKTEYFVFEILCIRKMEAFIKKVKKAHPLSWYRPGKTITVTDSMAMHTSMHAKYTYTLSEPPGKHFAKGFRPYSSPAKMLRQGVFEGKYLNDGTKEFPREWYEGIIKYKKIKFGPDGKSVADPKLNAFGIKSRLSIKEWRRRKWIPITEGDRDVRGWFQWYCRYWIGRRMPDVDKVQIARWKAFVRHQGQILASYRKLRSNKLRSKKPKTIAEKRKHRPKQRQALLQWAYNPYI